jgi:hypothetical protein
MESLVAQAKNQTVVKKSQDEAQNALSLPRLITPAQLAKIIHIDVRTLANQRVKGTGIPYLKIGAAIRYDMMEVSAFLEKCRHNSTSR